MHKRTFIKSLFAASVIALVPTRLFAQEKKQSTINGIPVNIYDCVILSEIQLDKIPKHSLNVQITVPKDVRHDINDILHVEYLTPDGRFLEFSGKIEIIAEYKQIIVYRLENCTGKLLLERCVVV